MEGVVNIINNLGRKDLLGLFVELRVIEYRNLSVFDFDYLSDVQGGRGINEFDDIDAAELEGKLHLWLSCVSVWVFLADFGDVRDFELREFLRGALGIISEDVDVNVLGVLDGNGFLGFESGLHGEQGMRLKERGDHFTFFVESRFGRG